MVEAVGFIWLRSCAFRVDLARWFKSYGIPWSSHSLARCTASSPGQYNADVTVPWTNALHIAGAAMCGASINRHVFTRAEARATARSAFPEVAIASAARSDALCQLRTPSSSCARDQTTGMHANESRSKWWRAPAAPARQRLDLLILPLVGLRTATEPERTPPPQTAMRHPSRRSYDS